MSAPPAGSTLEHPVEADADELQRLRALSAEADALIEGCLRERLSLRASLDRFLPAMIESLGAVGAAVLTRDEALNQAAFGAGELLGEDPWTLLTGREEGVHRIGSVTLVSQRLDVAGCRVGVAGFLFPGGLASAERVRERVRCICEELDAVLATIHTASEKQDLLERMQRALSHRVFEKGLDDAVALLARSVPLPTFLLVWRDVVEEDRLTYRLYRDGRLEFESGARPHPGLETAVRAHGAALLSPERNRLATTLGIDGGVEQVLLSRAFRDGWLGKCLVQGGSGGLSTFGLDLVRLLVAMACERLVDHSRERRTLSQYFAAPAIDALLHEPAYQEKYLSPREERIAILFADINGFTRICEQVLESPTRIGEFVDRWSAGAVDIVWRHGGTFDKMVGDCVIGLFGPPFFDEPPARRALRALRAAAEMQRFTAAFSEDPLLARLKERPDVAPGLGIAVGINLCPAYVGRFGPNQDVTAFSAGMNSTARLQSLAGFRETLAMESVVEALKELPEAADFQFGELVETPVKNVSRPLRYRTAGSR